MGALKIWDGAQWVYAGTSERGSAESYMAACTADTAISSTTATDITGMTVTLTSPGPGAVYMVDASLDVQQTTGGVVFSALLMVDGVSQGPAIILNGVAGTRGAYAKRWRVTGLAAGSHTFKMVANLGANSASAYTVNNTHSVMEIEQSLYGFASTGMKAKSVVTANSATFTTLTTLATVSVTVDGNTDIEVMFSYFDITKTVAGDAVNVYLYDGTTILMIQRLTNSVDPGGGTIRVIHTPAAGTHTYTVQAARVTGTGTATLQAAATYPAVLSVRPF